MILKKEKLNVGWCSCRVFEHVRIFRCFKCGGFNHKANDCKVGEKCKKCMGDHEEKDYISSVRKCKNCIEANEGNPDLNLDFNHYIYDASCPVLQRKVQIERRSVKAIQ